MQDMYTHDKQIDIYLRRRHRLIRAIHERSPNEQHNQTHIQQLVELFETLVNPLNGIPELAFYIKHQFSCDISNCIHSIIQFLQQMLTFKPGRLVAFIAYRLCVKYPSAYWKINSFLLQMMVNMGDQSKEHIAFMTDLYLYGFPITSDQFVNVIFPHFEEHILSLLPLYYNLINKNELFMHKHKRKMMMLMEAWTEHEQQKLVLKREELKKMGYKLQQSYISQQITEEDCNLYMRQFQSYETWCHKCLLIVGIVKGEALQPEFRISSIFQLKKSCQNFKKDYSLSDYERQLYLHSQAKVRVIQAFKKCQMTKIEENVCFINQLKVCKTIQQSFDYSGYFLEQMNTQHNREQLVEIVINECYSFNNLSYIVKVLAEIGQKQTDLREYCGMKAFKICGWTKMNQKYQRLMCELARFGLIHENTLLDYVDRIIVHEHIPTIKEIQSILQNLGTLIYYKCLSTHIRIDSIFERMEAMIKGRLIHFNMEHLFNVKCLHNYLLNHSNRKHVVERSEIQDIEIKSNFGFLKKKYEKMLKEKHHEQKIIQYLTIGIDQQEYITTYYYASLIKELAHASLGSKIIDRTISTIFNNIDQHYNVQKSVNWSRFLGELYNYEVINSNQLLQVYYQLLAKYHKTNYFMGALKCIGSSLETSMIYLEESEKHKQNKQTLKFLLELKRCIVSLKEQIAPAIKCEMQDIFEFFHPQLNNCLNSMGDIESLLRYYSTKNPRVCNLHSLIDDIAQGISISELSKAYMPLYVEKIQRESVSQVKSGQEKRRYKDQQLSPHCKKNIYKEKTLKYVEKQETVVKVQLRQALMLQIPSQHDTQQAQKDLKLSPKTEETVEAAAEEKPRIIKIMGKTRNGETKKKIIMYAGDAL